MLTALHFLRPEWLLLLPPLWLVAFWFARRRGVDGAWAQVVDASLLRVLRLNEGGRSRSPWGWIALAWTLGLLALAGPAWERQRTSGAQGPEDWIVVLDLSPSMEATDVAPSRVARARYAIEDLLATARDARVALVVFAGEAHIVAPLTTDVANVSTLLQPLAPSLMPETGHELAPALETAARLLRTGSSRRGDIVVFTDGCDDPTRALVAAARLRGLGARLHVVGVGTAAGAPQPDGSGGFVRDPQGKIELTRVSSDSLRRIAVAGGGDYTALREVPALATELRAKAVAGLDSRGEVDDLRVQSWRNEGYWLVLPLLGCAALVARRGWL
jgi:Ca-activated chloride channel family protein